MHVFPERVCRSTTVDRHKKHQTTFLGSSQALQVARYLAWVPGRLILSPLQCLETNDAHSSWSARAWSSARRRSDREDMAPRLLHCSVMRGFNCSYGFRADPTRQSTDQAHRPPARDQYSLIEAQSASFPWTEISFAFESRTIQAVSHWAFWKLQFALGRWPVPRMKSPTLWKHDACHSPITNRSWDHARYCNRLARVFLLIAMTGKCPSSHLPAEQYPTSCLHC